MSARVRARLRSWDGLLLGLVLVVIVFNVIAVPGYVGLQNQVNLWQNGIEKAIVVLAMAFVIINGEIDLSVASMMGLAAAVVALLWESGVPIEIGILVALATGALLGLFNGFWVAVVGLPSLAVTLAGLIGFRGLAFILIEDRSIGNDPTAFPRWFEDLGQQPLFEPVFGPVTLAMIIYFVLLALAATTLGSAGYGRKTSVIGSSSQVALYSGVNVRRHKVTIFMLSGLVAALAGVLYASHLGAVRGSTATGFELDVITIVLLGGVSIFGGSGTMLGVFLSTLLVLNIRNGLGLLNVPGHTQTGFVGVLLILSVLVPNLFVRYQAWSRRRTLALASHDARDGPVASAGRG
jgi:rhamnose transport system permease protein